MSPYNYAGNNPIFLQDFQGESPKISILPPDQHPRDPRLDHKALLDNPNFEELNVFRLRAMVREQFPDLEDWEVQISAGNVLETAYSDFTGSPKNKIPQFTTKGDDKFISIGTVRPDFIHPTFAEGPKGQTLNFTYGGVIEVKASDQPIKLNRQKGQIDRELNLVRYATSNVYFIEFFKKGKMTHASDLKAASLTFVLPSGGKIDDDIKN